MDRMVNVLLVAISVLISFAGLFFVMKIWMVWGRVDKKVLKARVFLDDTFLVRSWVYIFIVGAFIVSRRIIELFSLLQIRFEISNESVLFSFLGLIVVALLVLLSFDWYRLVYSAIEPSSHGNKIKMENK